MADKITLDELRELKNDWDGYGAVPPTEDAIALAELIVNAEPRVVPLSNGGVQIEWPVAGAEISITPEGTLELE
jgi:hypothetical protein